VARSAEHNVVAAVGLLDGALPLRTLEPTGLGSLAIRGSGPPTGRPAARTPRRSSSCTGGESALGRFDSVGWIQELA
jgi:hypothetical protein